MGDYFNKALSIKSLIVMNNYYGLFIISIEIQYTMNMLRLVKNGSIVHILIF